MNSPISDETAPIKEGQIRTWDRLPLQYNAVISVDPAYSEDDTADFKTAALVLCDSFGNRYLAHYIRTHAKIGEFQDAVINMWLSHRGEVTAIASAAARSAADWLAAALAMAARACAA